MRVKYSQHSGLYSFEPKADKNEKEAYFYQRYINRICWYYMNRGISPIKAEEMAHDLLVDVIFSNKLRKVTSKSAWLFRVAKNRLIDHYRKEKQIQGLPMPLEEIVEDSSKEFLKREELNIYLQSLPNLERQVIEKYYFEEQNLRGLADNFDCSTATAYRLLQDALSLLRRKYKDSL